MIKSRLRAQSGLPFLFREMEGFESLNEEKVQNFNLKVSVPRKGYDSLDSCIPWTQLFMYTRGAVV